MADTRQKNVVVSKPILYGSVATYLGRKAEETKTHRWSIYLRGVGNEDLSYMISKVVISLHVSFANPVRGALIYLPIGYLTVSNVNASQNCSTNGAAVRGDGARLGRVRNAHPDLLPRPEREADQHHPLAGAVPAQQSACQHQEGADCLQLPLLVASSTNAYCYGICSPW